MRSRVPALTWLALAAAVPACDITEVAIAEPDALVVAEGLVQVLADRVRVSVFLHPTVGALDPVDLTEALVQVAADGAAPVSLLRMDPRACLLALPREPVPAGACFVANHLPGKPGPGSRVTLRVTIPDGGRIEGATHVPGGFRMAAPAALATRDGAVCHLPPETPLPLTWTGSGGAWAYFVESLIHGLPASSEPTETAVRGEPLFLMGVSVSAADTTTTFPGNLGVFDRFGSDSGVLIPLQSGLPRGSHAEIHVAAVDRNYVNWVRGGGFNPSGQTRIPSVTGAGTGYFGSAVLLSFGVTTERTLPVPPSCLAP